MNLMLKTYFANKKTLTFSIKNISSDNKGVKMKFSCLRQSLCEAISSVSKAVSQKSTIAALEGIKIKLSPNQLELTGYDLEIGIRTTIPVVSEDSGEWVVNSRLFSEFSRRMAGENILFEIDENLQMNISSSNTQCSISAMSAEEYPELPVVDLDKNIEIRQDLLKSMINQTSYAASTSENKPVLTGELFEIENGIFRVVAIDGFRLAIRTENTDCQDYYHFVVPKKALSEVSGLIKDDSGDKTCFIYTNNKHIIFDINGFLVISRLLEGEFHNYKNSIPEGYKTEIIANKRDFLTCMERCSLLLNDKNRAPVKCTFENGEVKISCKTAIGKINDSFKADISGEAVTIGFNNKYALEALRAADGDKIKIQLNGCMKVIKIVPLESESYIFLLMPIQLK